MSGNNDLQPKCGVHEHMLQQLHHEVFGNGRPALRATITTTERTLEKAIVDVDKKVNDLTTQMETIIRMLKLILGAITPVVVVLVAYFLPRIFEQ